jgi:hypothetical protein
LGSGGREQRVRDGGCRMADDEAEAGRYHRSQKDDKRRISGPRTSNMEFRLSDLL